MNRPALLLLLPLLAGCNAQSKNPVSGKDRVTIRSDASGNVAFDLPFVKGQVNVPASMMHNGNFDIDGVRLMPGSSITGFSVFAADTGSTVNMSFTAPASADEVRSYFVDQFKQKGVEAALSGDAVTGKTSDGSPFTIQVRPEGSGSLGKIVIQAKD